jgi:hypothetical protein
MPAQPLRACIDLEVVAEKLSRFGDWPHIQASTLTASAPD